MTAALQGRSDELATVVHGLEAASGGRARAFALVGEPGIGKTRLTIEIAQRAEAAGFVACWGRAWEAGGAPAYWPWRLLVDALPGAPRDGSLGPLRGQGPATASEPDQARFELFDAISRAIRTAADGAPLLCILDDLHAADLPSLELAAFATRDLRACRVVWLLTWRDAEAQRAPVRDVIARIAREATVLPLVRLSADETGALVDDVATEATPELRAAIVRATGGNPLFVIETLASLRVRGGLPAELDRVPLAQGIAAVVRDRLAPVSAPARRAVDAASILGRELELARWADAADATAAVVQRHAKELAATGLLVEIGVDRWQFSHDLVREAIARELPADEVAAVHRRIATALDARVQDGTVALIGERAHHALAARMPEARVWSIAAADHARAQCAYEEALAIVERAIAALDAPRRDATLQLALGRARSDVGDAAGARDAFHAALDLARAAGDGRLAAEAVLGWGSRYVLGEILDELIALIDEVTALVPADATDLRARLLARKAAALTPAERPDQTLAMAREALRLVAGSLDARARLDVDVGVGSAFADFAHPRERIPVNQEMVQLARQLGDRALELRGLSRLVTDYIQAGELQRADALLPRRDGLARALQLPRFAWMEPLFRSMRAMSDGELPRCHEAIAEAQAIATTLSDNNALRAVVAHRTWLLLLEDNIPELLAYQPAVMAALRPVDPALNIAIRANIRQRLGDRDGALAEVSTLDPTYAYATNATLIMLAEVIAEVGPTRLLRPLRDRLIPNADTWSGWGLFALTAGPPISAYVGLVTAALGEPFAPWFDAALEATTVAGARAPRAWVRYWYGRALGDRSMLAAAAAEADAIGIARLAARCRAVDAAPAAPALVPTPAAIDWSIAQHGDAWRIERGGKSLLVPDVRGMAMIARLRERADQEIHALELVSGDTAVADAGDAGELLDARARAAYKKRHAELSEAIEDAEERGDADRAETAQDELDTLERELARAVGMGGRTRRAGASAERARISAQRRIREAIRKIAQVDSPLGLHLSQSIRTGTFCTYRPGKRNPSE